MKKNKNKTTSLHSLRLHHSVCLHLQRFQKKTNKTCAFSGHFALHFIIHSTVPHGGMSCVNPTFSEPQ